jgi:hypothetical protein
VFRTGSQLSAADTEETPDFLRLPPAIADRVKNPGHQ